MKKILNSMVVQSLALLLAASVSLGQAFAQERVAFRQAELDQMLAPIALYPDALLSQVLMASTYPLEVAQAARWSRANPGLKGQDAVRAVEHRDWDPSVKSLAAFPQVLAMMDEKLYWTERLGEAFLAQQADVMDSVQALRRRAEAAGNLRSSEQMRVAREGEVIYIRQPAPEIVYVPYYNPVVVYGPWWWPAYPPVFWGPPAYYVVPAYGPAFFWGPAIVISTGFFFGHCDWRNRHVTVVQNHVTNVVVRRPTTAFHHETGIVTNVRPVAWQHNPDHRRGIPYRVEAVRQQFQPSGSRGADVQPKVAAPAVRSEPLPAPRPAAVAPVIRTEPRPAVIRSEPRHDPRLAVVRSEPRHDPHPAVIRSEHRHDPRPAMNTERHVPRADNNPRERSAGRAQNGRS